MSEATLVTGLIKNSFSFSPFSITPEKYKTKTVETSPDDTSSQAMHWCRGEQFFLLSTKF
jgi:hypothetical protein